ncbi:hypothetical protein ACXWTF_00210 [Thiomicrolovo sp. ZZH C-3]
MSVGQELLDVPLDKMVASLAMGVAEAQRALDENSLITTLELADSDNNISYIPQINVETTDSGVNVTTVEANDIPLIAFIRPTWYQFSETTIEVSMDIKTKSETSTKVKVGAKAKFGWGPFSASINVDVEHNRKFGKEVHGTSRMVVKMVPVPPPPLLLPEINQIDSRTPPPSS